MGYRRARYKARAELEALQRDYHELAVEHHRQCYDRALDKAIMQRAMDANMVLH
jgi:mannose-1-phosphate guanylyltransferase